MDLLALIAAALQAGELIVEDVLQVINAHRASQGQAAIQLPPLAPEVEQEMAPGVAALKQSLVHAK